MSKICDTCGAKSLPGKQVRCERPDCPNPLPLAAPSEAEGILRELEALVSDMRIDGVIGFATSLESIISRHGGFVRGVRADNTGKAGESHEG